MARHAITIIAIAAIILASTCRLSAEPTEFTVLTYNTHLFRGVNPVIGDKMPQYEDETRREYIAGEIAASGADIVALQEVWGHPWQQWFAETLKAIYPYPAYVYSGCDTYVPTGLDSLSNGLLLLSKRPLSNVKFERFPTFFPSCGILDAGNPECENWANKGVLTATADVGGAPVRIGISHALLGPSDEKSKWDTAYIGNAITTFQLNGQAYVFALKKDNTARIVRMEDYSYVDQSTQTQKHGAGWKHFYTGAWGSDHIAVTSFELNGHPYLFGVNTKNEGHIERINDDGKGWTNMKYGAWGSDHIAVTSFQLNGHPHLFGVNTKNEGHIERINDDGKGWTTMKYGPWGSDHIAVISFQLNGHPYLFGVNTKNEGHIERINDDGKGWTTMKYGAWGHEYEALTSFELDGHPYIFGLTEFNQGHITRINDDPSTGWSFVSEWKEWDSVTWPPSGRDYIAVKSFSMNGHPYLFALKNCCDQITCCNCWPWQICDSCLLALDPSGHFASYPSRCEPCLRGFPGEAYLKRINADPNSGWEGLYQLEDMRIIRDQTAVDEDGPPAIMMGDFNIHASKYGVMDQLFRKAGAVDAYIEVHGTGEGGETIDWYNNKLLAHFHPEQAPSRIDYVYVKPSGGGLRLVPTEANVIRDWKYGAGDMDLSDHYPLVVKFRLEAGCEPQLSADFDCDGIVRFSDLAILCSAWLSGPGGTWDRACDIGDPGNDFIDSEDFGAFARAWMKMLPVHNLTRDKAYAFIQRAVNDANDGDEIEVGPGTYYEAINFKGKAIYLHSSDGPEATILDATGLNASVVICTSGEKADSILEDFTLTGGNGTDISSYLYGGGMYNQNSSPTVNHCIFTSNSVNTDGGGMFNGASNPVVTDCIFSNNTANRNGGAMYNASNSNPTVTRCTFAGNKALSADYGGGGMFNNNACNPTVKDCIFRNNTAIHNAGGMYNITNSSPTVTNCTFADNSAGYDGGGMYNTGNSNAVLIGCTFNNNVTYGNNGGGMHNASSNPKLTNCIFSRNIAQKYGGGVFNTAGRPTLTNCIFYENTVLTASGGGYANYNGSNSTLINCTVYQNLAGCGLRNWDSTLVVTNCILWSNYGCEISSDGASSLTVSYSDVQGGYAGTANINELPFFVDPDGGDLRLSSGSSCIDTGSNAAVPSGITTDLDGNPRVLDGDSNGTDIVDMGACEYLPGAPAAGSAANFEAYCILAANWLEVP